MEQFFDTMLAIVLIWVLCGVILLILHYGLCCYVYGWWMPIKKYLVEHLL